MTTTMPIGSDTTIDLTGDPGSPVIRTPDQRLRVFISSTLGELAAERDAARTAVRTLRLAPVMFELGARPHAPQDLYRSYLDQSDVFVGIYWQSYGWVGPGQTVSGIHDEYALSGDRPRLIYVKEPAADRDEQLSDLLEVIKNDNRASYKRFESPGELAEILLDDLAVLLTERFLDRPHVDRTPLPTGTLTFLMADLEDATGMMDRLGDGFRPVLDSFAGMVSSVAHAHDGRMVDMEEDRTVSVFASPRSAADAAIELQQRSGGRAMDGTAPRIRVGLHTGVAQPTDHGYVGIDAHRAARIAATGHGGQIVVSAATRALLDEDIARLGWHLRDLGTFALKGLSRSERLFQLEVPGLAHGFPPPRARSSSRVDLPAQLTSLVGRDDEISGIAGLMAVDHVRLVTVTGPGGIGKTRVGLAVAERVSASYPDGVFFVNLASVEDRGGVITAIGDATGVALDGAPMEALAEAFAHSKMLLVLDNFEQVVQAGLDVAELLRRCPGINVLATSREPLRVRGEQEYPMGPLGVPRSDDHSEVAESTAVRLFVDRARSVRPGFTLGPDNLTDLAAITRLVEGVPLAIELAAARLRTLGPAALVERLAGSFDALGPGPSDLPNRQRTIRATIEWSHDMLGTAERRLFRRLSVFAGEFDIDGVERVAADADDGDVLPILESLVDKSLVRSSDGGEPRFRLLIALREFGRDRLAAAGETEEVRDRHAMWVAEWAEGAAQRLSGPDQGPTIARVALQWSDVQSAVDWLLRRRDVGEVVRILYAMWIFIWVTDRVSEVDGWLRAVRTVGGKLADRDQGRLDWMCTSVAFEQGDYTTASRLSEASIEAATAAGDEPTLAWATFLQALITPAFDSDPATVESRLGEANRRFVLAGDRFGEGFALMTFGILATAAGRIEEAERLHHSSLRIAEDLGFHLLVGQVKTQLAFTCLASGRLAEAREALSDAIDVFSQHHSQEGIAYVLEALATLAFREERLQHGMVAMGAAEGVRRRFGIRSWPSVQWFFEMLTATADSMVDGGLQAARQAATKMDPYEAASIALSLRTEEVAA